MSEINVLFTQHVCLSGTEDQSGERWLLVR